LATPLKFTNTASKRKKKEEEQQSEVSGTHHKQNGWLLHVDETSVSSKKNNIEKP